MADPAEHLVFRLSPSMAYPADHLVFCLSFSMADPAEHLVFRLSFSCLLSTFPEVATFLVSRLYLGLYRAIFHALERGKFSVP